MRQWDNKTMTTKGESDYYTGLEPKAKLRYKKKLILFPAVTFTQSEKMK